MHGSPMQLPLILNVVILLLVVGNAIGQRYEILFDGHVLCRIGNGTADVPVKNAEVTIMEEDPCWLNVFDCDEALGSAITDAAGAFSLEGESAEFLDNIKPYLLIKACRNETSCNVKKFFDPQSGVTVKNYNYFLDDEFCQHCEAGRECQSAKWD